MTSEPRESSEPSSTTSDSAGGDSAGAGLSGGTYPVVYIADGEALPTGSRAIASLTTYASMLTTVEPTFDDMPEGCPPEDALSCSGVEVLRVLYGEKPEGKDFRRYWQEGKGGKKDDCKANGMSVFLTIADLNEIAEIVPALQDRWYARLMLVHSDGVIKNTPSRNSDQHQTWLRSVQCMSPENRAVEAGKTMKSGEV